MTSKILSFDFKEFIDSSIKTTKIIIITVIPYFLLAELLIYFELMPYIAEIFKPLTKLLGLPPETALALASGILLNLYAAIAFAAPLNLSAYDWTVLGLFLGVMHSIPIEATIIKKLGISFKSCVVFRLVMAFVVLTPLLIIPNAWLFTEADLIVKNSHYVNSVEYINFIDFIVAKLIAATLLSIEIIMLVSVIIFINTAIKGLSFLRKFDRHLSFTIALITGSLIGITYGSGMLIKEAKNMSRKQVLAVCYFLMVSHAIIEDSLLFVIFGANMSILVISRLFFASIVLFVILFFYKTNNKSKIMRPLHKLKPQKQS